MSDQEHIELSAKQTPLPDLLDRVPEDIVLGIPGDEPMFPSYTNIPIGRLARQAAAELRRLHAENERLHQINQSHEMKLSVRGYEIQIADLEAQRDALLEALKEITPSMPPVDAPCHYGIVPQEKCGHCGRIAKARAAIKAVEEGK